MTATELKELLGDSLDGLTQQQVNQRLDRMIQRRTRSLPCVVTDQRGRVIFDSRPKV